MGSTNYLGKDCVLVRSKTIIMTITVVMGSQFGDEGKGKLTDILAPKAELCARAAGGHNAGHQIVANGVSYSFHLLPSGLINPSCMNLIGADVVFYAPSFFKELQELEDKGLKDVRDKILVSDRCNIVLDLHVAVDGLEEVELGARQIGTTRRGIGPTYACKHARNGIRLAEIFDPELFERKLRQLEQGYRKRFGDLLEYDVDDELKRFETYRAELKNYTVDSTALMYQAQKDNKAILIEGANALMLDITHGGYLFVTSSSTTIAGIINGLSLNPRGLTEVIGVVKTPLELERVASRLKIPERLARSFKSLDTNGAHQPAVEDDAGGSTWSSFATPTQ